MFITKEKILSLVTSYDILNFYLQPFHNFDKLIPGKNFNNPFLPKKQNTPSFNIYKSSELQEFRFKDFSTADEGGCFDLVMKLFNFTFSEALNKIKNDMNLQIDVEDKYETSTLRKDNFNTIKKPTIINKIANSCPNNPDDNKNKYILKKRQFNDLELAYWNQYGISVDVLRKFNVSAIDEYSSFSKQGNPYTCKGTPLNFIFAYENNNWAKIYKPLDDKKYRFQYLGIKDPEFIFGWKQLPESGASVFITGGEKDTMTLVAHGYNAISLNSETAILKENTVSELKLRFKNVIIIYDNDETGLKQSDLNANSHSLFRVVLPQMPGNGKDISDYFAKNGSIDDFQKLINSTIETGLTPHFNADKAIYNALELMELGNIEPKYLLDPIFPQKGTAVLAGKPDTGKSQFARQLCISVALGIDTFLDFQLNVRHHNSIYVATEDNLEATQFLLSKQMNGLNVAAKENLRFIFADTMSQNEIIGSLENELSRKPADLVVVDSFGDIFTGTDSNNSIAMRNTVKTFDKISKQFNCLVIFVHHINKGAYRQAPGQEHIQGGAGLMQKVRLGIQLSEGENSIRYLTVVKGNYCPKTFKENSMILNFSEQNFLFENTGKTVPTNDLGTQVDPNRKEEKYSELENHATEIFSDKILSYSNFVKEYCNLTGKSIPTAKRAHTNLVKLELIIDCNGGYRLNTPLNYDSNEDEF